MGREGIETIGIIGFIRLLFLLYTFWEDYRRLEQTINLIFKRITQESLEATDMKTSYKLIQVIVACTSIVVILVTF
jgi:hypothetical protein